MRLPSSLPASAIGAIVTTESQWTTPPAGSVFGPQARFDRSKVSIAGEGRDFVRVGDEGTRSTFTFCPERGATVYYVMAGHEESIAIPVGAFADPSFPAPTFSVYEERMHSWVTMPRDIEHMR